MAISSVVKSIRERMPERSNRNDNIFECILDVIKTQWHLGFTAFGGPPVHFQIFHQLFVDKHRWIDEQTYQELFAISQALPGPGSTKMLFCINSIRHGFIVGTFSFLLWSLPGAVGMYALSLGIQHIKTGLPSPVYALLSGLNAATVGIVLLAAVQLSQKAITDKLTRLLVFLGGAAGMLYTALWYFPVLMVAGGLATLLWDLRVPHRLASPLIQKYRRRRQRSPDEPIELTPPTTQADAEPHPAPASQPSLPLALPTGLVLLTAFALTFLPLMLTRGLLHPLPLTYSLFANLYLAGTIIFGGGPVVIPLLREYIVSPGWVSPRDFLLGLALIQAFPGPNFNFAVYLGALTVADETPLASVLGAALGFVAIFAPGVWVQTAFLGVCCAGRAGSAACCAGCTPRPSGSCTRRCTGCGRLACSTGTARADGRWATMRGGSR